MKRTVRVLIIFATTTLTLGYHSQIQAQAVQWRLIGPGTRGTMRGPAFHPTNPSIFSIGIDMGLHFITRDGGITWNLFHFDVPLQLAVFVQCRNVDTPVKDFDPKKPEI